MSAAHAQQCMFTHAMHIQYDISEYLSNQAAILKGCRHNGESRGLLEKQCCRAVRDLGSPACKQQQ